MKLVEQRDLLRLTAAPVRFPRSGSVLSGCGSTLVVMAEAQRAWLDVPYADKDAAKALGARWDPRERRWYDPQPTSSSGLGRWAARPPVPELLPGEDRSFGSGLFVDLVPSSCWFTNVRSCVEPADWERLRRMILGRAGQRCEACGRGEDRPSKRWLEAHERWTYDERAGVQALRRLICLCTDCHRTTHYGLARVQGREAEAFEHLCAVTGMSAGEARAHVTEAFALWQTRSARTWALDLTALTGVGITVTPPPSAQQRPVAAENALRIVKATESPPPAPVVDSEMVEGDLTANQPGQAAAAVADDYHAVTPVLSRVAPLLGMRTAEQPWRAGAAGEAATARALRRLTHPPTARWLGRAPRWFVLHAIPVGERGADIDHLLLGPAGVFTINTKHHPGKTVWAGDHAITVNRAPSRYAEKARAEADRAARLLAAASGGITVPVTPVIAIVGARVTGRGTPRGVAVAEADLLPGWLRRLPRRLRDDEVADLYAVARRLTTWQRR